MPPLVLLSPTSGAGKTTIATALAQKFQAAGRTVGLSRTGEDENSAADSAVFAPLATGAELELIEAPGGEATAAPGARAVVVADGGAPTADLVAFCGSLGERLMGLVVNRVPSRRREGLLQELGGQGLKPLFDMPEDRALATPNLGQVVAALDAETLYFDSNGERALARLLIAPVSADPGQYYFVYNEAKAVIVRSDKPDLQLAALNAGATCLIVTGEFPLLGYVTERAEYDEVPIIRTQMDTVNTVQAIEGLYAAAPFSGARDKLSRLAELTRDFDVTPLFGA